MDFILIKWNGLNKIKRESLFLFHFVVFDFFIIKKLIKYILIPSLTNYKEKKKAF